MFENTAIREGWERVKTGRDCWCPYSLVRLNKPTSPCHSRCQTNISSSRRKSWSAWGFLQVCVAQYFHDWEYKPHLPARAQAAELFRLAQYWLLDGEPTAAQIAEHVVVNRLLRALPRTHSQAVGMWNPATIDELVEAMELADAAQHRDAGEQAPPFPRRVVQERRTSEGTLQPVSRLAAPTPRDKPMPTEVQPNPQTDAATSGSWGQARLGPHAVICTVWYTRGTSGFDRLHPFRATVGGCWM